MIGIPCFCLREQTARSSHHASKHTRKPRSKGRAWWWGAWPSAAWPSAASQIAPAPGQDRGAVDDHIAATDQVGVAREVDEHDEEQLVGRRSRLLGTLALLGRAAHAHAAAGVARQPAGQREGWPGHQPI